MPRRPESSRRPRSAEPRSGRPPPQRGLAGQRVRNADYLESGEGAGRLGIAVDSSTTPPHQRYHAIRAAVAEPRDAAAHVAPFGCAPDKATRHRPGDRAPSRPRPAWSGPAHPTHRRGHHRERHVGRRGRHRRRERTQSDARGRVRVASITKTFTAALVMRLVEQGKIDLDEPLALLLGDLNVDTNGATVRQALEMRAGLADYPQPAAADHIHIDAAHVWTAEEMVAEMDAPVAAAGETYSVLERGATDSSWPAQPEHVTGMSHASALRDELLDPWQLDRIIGQGPERVDTQALGASDRPGTSALESRGPRCRRLDHQHLVGDVCAGGRLDRKRRSVSRGVGLAPVRRRHRVRGVARAHGKPRGAASPTVWSQHRTAVARSAHPAGRPATARSSRCFPRPTP